MGEVVEMPMTWADAARLVANALGLPAEDFARMVVEAIRGDAR